MPYARMSTNDSRRVAALRHQLYEQPRWLFVGWTDPISASVPRHWAFFVGHAEDTAYGMRYQIVKSTKSGLYALDVSPGQMDGFAGCYKVGKIALRVEGAFAANSYGGLVLDEVNERNSSPSGSAADKTNDQTWVMWMLECLERNQLVEVGSADRPALGGQQLITCRIPGPIEIADDVLYANAHHSVSHMAPDFAAAFKECLHMIRQVLFTTTAQPFLISGSGTLGWDQARHTFRVSANLVEPKDDVLVLNSGYFGDAFADCLQVYGANVDTLRAPLGAAVDIAELEAALARKQYKAVTVTHVDTSTGVLSPIKDVAQAVRKVSPNTLVVVDGVCSVASEEIRFDEWDIDVVLSASQKGIGIPPGLSIVMASERAMKVFHARSSPVTSWLPIMQAYDKGSAAYFATPPTNLIWALHASLSTITKSSPSLEERFALHKSASAYVKQELAALGLKQIPLKPEFAANGMTAVYFPEGVTASDVVPQLGKQDIVIAGGLHKDIKEKYFRIGHMGITVVDRSRGDLTKVVEGIKSVMQALPAKS
ncbi:PLP-dependent transferase [Exidia glandulosa HHB12029]|uniref:alanine--glyoxylate transaminase n=1 Tax=Exidia glandulosa HHB12029 TaxID=1314781 RepID=A0A165DYY8_EXIGL|nr:PLP-dependent transferase [Exidia glandulosa HHB12029]